ncbi:bifunctional 3-(3-hydroxy-phenyl)propionate/3-hydroxycinnamic acid hydroxylase [Pseudomonas hefeiensis]|uniref:Bifunctional 3-(3-hydroxy-phenyl)propionate/3-hydroxycinnamic acid hydroxylase n=1 Tax=Pseudomonas hefeiensis TaxID=2738125 RepID=A0ABY9GGV7_9PSED|nr:MULTISPECIES: bifunctional 3-(3-hydroxy-phenyl)propionate/3-hydroxycinnamic acid hydroxylase [unclassified Pseudomonas]WLH14786.1 bifunctional 3-(3-hydroxy-phenyl)propionate/3-hydroxycinnamic acid hydroxylase [Pseudomonas sp. FP205]WLH97837.1 bifunctional 3-(3-hydroxy-phenyl)propionate/3-hydroxycinnamic acid hydroxylase [Pseudomonas sp. FP53]WLI42112.1 bifunctional 3-(3-hydroxy-phenyl)propionate/3-hydroxycinnamic acid hydroxylase [Pseudomonas sp. FP821]
MLPNQDQAPIEQTEFFDIAIIGYGPTGLVAASMLGRAGYKVLVIERWPTPYGLPRLSHIDGETARIIQASGNIEDALRDACAVRDYHYRDAHGDLLTELDWTGEACGFPAHISIYQPDIEEAINQQAMTFPGVKILRGWEAQALKQTKDEVTVSARSVSRDQDCEWTGISRKFSVKYLIGADGANSHVRRALAIERTDFGHNERWLNLDSENKHDLGGRFSHSTIFCDPARAHMYMPIGSKRTRFELRILPGEDTAHWEKEATGWQWLEEQHGLGPDDLHLLRHVVYTFETRIANQWRVDRVLLAGDAAHTMMPYMGQGACSGMRDGINLAWKLDLVLSGRCTPALLDSYEQERRPHVMKIMEMALFLGQLANEDDPEKVAQRDHAFLTGKVPPMPPFPKLEDGVLYRESDGTLLPSTGAPAPQGRVRRGNAEKHLDDVVGQGFHLMALQDPTDVLNDELMDFLNQLGCRQIILTEDPNVSGAVSELDDKLSTYMSTHGMQAYISRPDFLVFGSVESMERLPDLIQNLREQLHWQEPATSMNAAKSQASLSGGSAQ